MAAALSALPTRIFPLTDADQCVKCGLCLPHCPTYVKTRDEGDSPRGRIALMQGLATARIPLTPRVEAHLDGCLACRSCEVVCPAGVEYGRLIDAGREQLAQRKPGRTRLTASVGGILARPGLRRFVHWLLWLYQRSGIEFLVRVTRSLGIRKLARLASLLPVLERPRRLAPISAARGTRKGRVAMFTGCVSELADPQALRDSVFLLTQLGYEVLVPETQNCCGALHLHNGLRDQAEALCRQNRQAFPEDCTAILGTASGCTATLREYDQLDPGTAAASFSARADDVLAFLARCEWPADIGFEPLHKRVALQEPCTLRNVLKTPHAAYELLSKIPALEVVPLAGNHRCCGAAGSYFITETEMADRLVEDKLQALEAQPVDMLLTTNIGCAMHIAGALRRSRKPLPVLHPVSLLARQLRRAG